MDELVNALERAAINWGNTPLHSEEEDKAANELHDVALMLVDLIRAQK